MHIISAFATTTKTCIVRYEIVYAASWSLIEQRCAQIVIFPKSIGHGEPHSMLLFLPTGHYFFSLLSHLTTAGLRGLENKLE
jgi:hypothetical protein